MKLHLKICDIQVSTKESLAHHKKAVHEGVIYICGQCGYKSTTKGHLVKHKKTVHERVKYPCRICDHQATSKGKLAQHKWAVLDNVDNVIIRQLQTVFLLIIKGLYMKESNILADNVANKE